MFPGRHLASHHCGFMQELWINTQLSVWEKKGQEEEKKNKLAECPSVYRAGATHTFISPPPPGHSSSILTYGWTDRPKQIGREHTCKPPSCEVGPYEFAEPTLATSPPAAGPPPPPLCPMAPFPPGPDSGGEGENSGGKWSKLGAANPQHPMHPGWGGSINVCVSFAVASLATALPFLIQKGSTEYWGIEKGRARWRVFQR